MHCMVFGGHPSGPLLAYFCFLRCHLVVTCYLPKSWALAVQYFCLAEVPETVVESFRSVLTFYHLYPFLCLIVSDFASHTHMPLQTNCQSSFPAVPSKKVSLPKLGQPDVLFQHLSCNLPRHPHTHKKLSIRCTYSSLSKAFLSIFLATLIPPSPLDKQMFCLPT